MSAKHVHQFKTAAHLDGCHWYSTIGRCACGAQMTITHERDFKADPYSMVWAEPQWVEITRDPETGRFVKPRWEEKRCKRCAELQAGAKLTRTVIIAKGDKVERQEITEHAQGES